MCLKQTAQEMKDRESRRLEKKSPTSKVGVTELKVKIRCEDWKISTEKFSGHFGNRTLDLQLCRRARYPCLSIFLRWKSAIALNKWLIIISVKWELDFFFTMVGLDWVRLDMHPTAFLFPSVSRDRQLILITGTVPWKINEDNHDSNEFKKER